MPNVPFWIRLIVLVAVLAVAGGIDRWRKGPEARRWREYAFLLAMATVGGVFAASVDQVSLALAPEYFTVGKELAPGEGLRWRVTQLGFHAGFLAGGVGAGVLLLCNQPREDRPALPYRRLTGALPWVLAPALALGVVGALAWPGLARALELRMVRDLAVLLEPDRAAAYLQVNGLHGGLYLGAVVGLVVGAVRVRRARR